MGPALKRPSVLSWPKMNTPGGVLLTRLPPAASPAYCDVGTATDTTKNTTLDSTSITRTSPLHHAYEIPLRPRPVRPHPRKSKKKDPQPDSLYQRPPHYLPTHYHRAIPRPQYPFFQNHHLASFHPPEETGGKEA